MLTIHNSSESQRCTGMITLADFLLMSFPNTPSMAFIISTAAVHCEYSTFMAVSIHHDSKISFLVPHHELRSQQYICEAEIPPPPP